MLARLRAPVAPVTAEMDSHALTLTSACSTRTRAWMYWQLALTQVDRSRAPAFQVILATASHASRSTSAPAMLTIVHQMAPVHVLTFLGRSRAHAILGFWAMGFLVLTSTSA